MSPFPQIHTNTKKNAIGDLDGEHLKILLRAINRVLSTEIAEVSYTQIVDGLPLADVARETISPYIPINHPIYGHKKLCPQVWEKVRQFRESFDPATLQIEAPLLRAYRSAPPGSRLFLSRLIEIVAVAVHQIAIYLFQSGSSLHKHDGVTEWAPRKPEGDIETLVFDDKGGMNALWWYFNPKGPQPTLFFHTWYTDYQRYPNGVADMVGYWAEARILGGMAQFDRRENGDTSAIYLHADRRNIVTYRIFELLPEQKQALGEFLAADSCPPICPLPILGNQNNRHRFDPEESSATNGIYRDIWERLDLPPDVYDMRLKDVIDTLDYPGTIHTSDRAESQARASDRRMRIELLQAGLEGDLEDNV